jgi:hypothetical protein
MDGTLDEDHPPLVFVSEKVPHFTDVSEQALSFITVLWTVTKKKT